MNRILVLVVLLAAILPSACGPSSSERIAAANVHKPATESTPVTAAMPVTSVGRPRVVTPTRRLQCVPYAREQSGIPIRGDAWTWWHKAKGKYRRTSRPAVGSVIVFSKTKRNRYGHLAVVTQIVSEREILARHANWLNKGQIHVDTPIRDVSRNNDWSAVRVWYTPGGVFGKHDYPVSGFILPPARSAAG